MPHCLLNAVVCPPLDFPLRLILFSTGMAQGQRDATDMDESVFGAGGLCISIWPSTSSRAATNRRNNIPAAAGRSHFGYCFWPARTAIGLLRNGSH
ncbi:hypothetical protein MGWOODY_Hyp2022 [hydrothermal vent metagenome]|uniref:Uncharacterized protein n=1 Tax=hydrothermal vent metagenome TaxID=652676 RepID=A0A160U1K9_9ZZZZ